jgi:transporter family-2 protein
VSRTLAIVCALAAGVLVGLQPPANAQMSRHVGDLGAALISVAITITVMAAIFAIFGDAGRLSGLRSFRPQWALGGLGGAAVVAVAIVAVKPLGAGAVVALLVGAQLFSSIAADRLGWFGLHHVALSPGRIAGFLLVVGGTVLVTRS